MASFDLLSPDLAGQGVEEAYGLDLDGTVQAYPSYVNRVYGLRDSDGGGFVAKFYRPGRWNRDAILEEHLFLSDCASAELPVVCPLANADGESLSELVLETEDGREEAFLFALFPKMGGRNFDPETDDDWLRLGALAGRLHAAGRKRVVRHRLRLDPDFGRACVAELLGRPAPGATAGDGAPGPGAGNRGARECLVHAECREEFAELSGRGLELAERRFEGLSFQRVHGDLHRGNILDRPGSGLVVVDFDDMLSAPPAQDLWLLLPGRKDECGRELALILEGYGEFSPVESAGLRATEALRLLRMLYFLTWRARQRDDYWFRREFPDWGGRAFWISEVEDLRDQVRCLEAEEDR
jgi:Ser/Thr protein kinase RdoA (MazF antagonist)